MSYEFNDNSTKIVDVTPRKNKDGSISFEVKETCNNVTRYSNTHRENCSEPSDFIYTLKCFGVACLFMVVVMAIFLLFIAGLLYTVGHI